MMTQTQWIDLWIKHVARSTIPVIHCDFSKRPLCVTGSIVDNGVGLIEIVIKSDRLGIMLIGKYSLN